MHNEIVGEKGAEKMKVLVFAEESVKQRVSELMKGEEASSAEMTGRLRALVQPQREFVGNYAGKGWRA
jgi:hypothetical protein